MAEPKRTLVKLMVLIVVCSMAAFRNESCWALSKILSLSFNRTSKSKGSNCGVITVLFKLAYTGKLNRKFLGNNFPASIFAATSNWNKLSLARSFTRCSMVPKPWLRLLAANVILPKSARVISILPKAAQPPSSFKADKRNSFTHISAC